MPYTPLKISIPKPCGEDWTAMTPVDELRRHCATCEKNITDFTHMSDREMGRVLRENGGNLCGRFRRDQLDRELRLDGPRRRRGMGALAASVSLLFSVPAFGQQTALAQTEQLPVGSNKQKIVPAAMNVLKGVVLDDNQEPLFGASILIKGTTTGTATDIYGKFSLDLPVEKSVTILISYTGFKTVELTYTAEALEAMAVRDKATERRVINLVREPLAEEAIVVGLMVNTVSEPSLADPAPSSLFTLQGRVTDEQGEPLIGASILIKGTTTGTVTDLDGRFSLAVSDAAPLVLVFSYTGFSTQERAYSVEELRQLAKTKGETPQVLQMMLQESVMGFFVGAIVVHHKKPSALENLMVHKIDRFTPDRPTGPAKTGDWKDYWRDLFARRKARRAERKAERLARRSARQDSGDTLSLNPPPARVKSKVAADVVTTFGLRASPNPFAEQLRISFTLPRSQEVKLLLFDLDGRKLWQQQFSGTAGDHQLMVNNSLDGLPSGAYLLRIIGDGGLEETIRLIR